MDKPIHILYDNGTNEAILTDTPNWDDDWWERYFPDNTGEVDAWRVDSDMTPQGIRYFWELSGPDGAFYLILPEPCHSNDDVKAAKAFIRYSFDVVTLRTKRIRRWKVPEYQSAMIVLPGHDRTVFVQIDNDGKLASRIAYKTDTTGSPTTPFVMAWASETDAAQVAVDDLMVES